MSDEAKRSRAWIAWTLVAALVLYPLSIGPVARLAVLTNSDGEWINTIYAPILRAAEWPEISGAIFRYLELWGVLARPVPDE